MPNHFGMCSVGVLRTRGVWMPSPPYRRFNVVRSRISASAHSALHTCTCGDPPLKGVALRERNQASFCCFSGQANG